MKKLSEIAGNIAIACITLMIMTFMIALITGILFLGTVLTVFIIIVGIISIFIWIFYNDDNDNQGLISS